MLCKHEVVGSIPSGSTIGCGVRVCVVRGWGFGLSAGGLRWRGVRRAGRDWPGALFDIVKRTFIRLRAGVRGRAFGAWSGASACAAYIAPVSDGCEARWSYLSVRIGRAGFRLGRRWEHR